jgi:hypothetical protein
MFVLIGGHLLTAGIFPTTPLIPIDIGSIPRELCKALHRPADILDFPDSGVQLALALLGPASLAELFV